MTVREEKSFCRLCMAHCGMVLSIDEGRLLSVRGDHDDEQTLGYACFKGLQAPQTHYAPGRILRPLKRQPDGSFAEIGLEQALAEIAEKTAAILDRDGPEAIAGYRGSQGIITSSAAMMLPAWLRALGSPKFFTSATIDQSAKLVSLGRIGLWPAGRVPFQQADVLMIFGGNPLLSISSNSFDIRNPQKRLKAQRAAGMKLIVIDPRATETAQQADIFLQPVPGEDAAIAAGLLHIILRKGWEDREFCAQYVSQLDELRAAVAPFTPDYVARRAGVPAEQLHAAAAMFARDHRRGPVASGTGPNMSQHSNLAEHLFECMNVVCGRYLREGERIPNPGVLAHRWPRKAQVMSAPRWWEHGFKSRIGGFGVIDGEMMTGILADEILEPGPGRVRVLFNDGGGIVNAVPDQRKIARALGDLELLVSIEPFMTPTAQLSHYILPPKMHFERADLPMYWYESIIYPEPFTRYTPPMLPAPENSELVDDWYVFWSVAKQLGLAIDYDGTPLDMENAPATDDLLAIIAKRAPLPLDEIRKHPLGLRFDDHPQYVEPGEPGNTDRFTVMPADVYTEMRELAGEALDSGLRMKNGALATHRLVVRRQRDMYNSTGRFVPTIRERLPYNVAYLHPDDRATLAVEADAMIDIVGDHGSIRAAVADDPTLRSGVVAISHGFGGLPGRETDYRSEGVSTNLLTSTSENLQAINAMPQMSSLPVQIRAARD
jgi:anaerobic selenocysteine-containing dehydrogenase